MSAQYLQRWAVSQATVQFWQGLWVFLPCFRYLMICNEVKNGDLVAVDGFKGNVIVSPSNDDIKEFENKQEAYLKDKESLKQYFGKPTVTKSGIKKLVYGNIGKAEDVQSVIQNSGEGIGLFRTEFLLWTAKASRARKNSLRHIPPLQRQWTAKK